VVSGEDYLTWIESYYGGVLEVRMSGTPFVTSAGGGKTLPCVAEETRYTPISEP
jgi:hypothetical protein